MMGVPHKSAEFARRRVESSGRPPVGGFVIGMLYSSGSAAGRRRTQRVQMAMDAMVCALVAALVTLAVAVHPATATANLDR